MDRRVGVPQPGRPNRVTPGPHDGGMDADEPIALGYFGCEPPPGDWSCPVCGADTPHEFRPGRKRVYCSNACKQRAYRWRCDRGIRLLVTPWTPASRSETGPRSHAVRLPVDRASHPADQWGRHVAVCGAFARRVDPRRAGHTEFVPGGRRSCRACTRLIGADPAWHDEYPLFDLDERGYPCVYVPPEERRRRSARRRLGGSREQLAQEPHQELRSVAPTGERHHELTSVVLELGAPRQSLESRLF